MDDSLLSELVGQHPSLYDPKNKNYKDQNVKDYVWKEIAGVLEQPVDECKKRWKNIRDTYNRRKRMGTGSSRSKKASKWYLNDVLSFLNTIEHERLSSSNVAPANLRDNSTSENNQNEPEDTTQSQQEETLKEEVLSETSCSDTIANIHEESEPDDVILTKRKKLVSPPNCPKRQKINISKRNSNAWSERLNTTQTANEEHPIDSFFRSMAASVKKLSQSSQIIAKMEICRIVGEMELKELQQSSAGTSF